MIKMKRKKKRKPRVKNIRVEVRSNIGFRAVEKGGPIMGFITKD